MQFGVTEGAIFYWLSRCGIARRTVSQARSIKKWGLYGKSNPMYGRIGNANPNWRGGVTPERQLFLKNE